MDAIRSERRQKTSGKKVMSMSTIFGYWGRRRLYDVYCRSVITRVILILNEICFCDNAFLFTWDENQSMTSMCVSANVFYTFARILLFVARSHENPTH